MKRIEQSSAPRDKTEVGDDAPRRGPLGTSWGLNYWPLSRRNAVLSRGYFCPLAHVGHWITLCSFLGRRGATRRDAFLPEFRDHERRAVARDNGEMRGWIDRVRLWNAAKFLTDEPLTKNYEHPLRSDYCYRCHWYCIIFRDFFSSLFHKNSVAFIAQYWSFSTSK